MPMTAARQVVGFAHDAIGPPGDDVASTRRDVEPAARTRVMLLRAGGGDHLNVPLAVTFGLPVTVPEEGTTEVDL